MSDLSKLSALADELFDAETEVARLEAELKQAQSRMRRISEFDLPEAMDDVGVTELKTSSGLVVKVAEKLHAKKLTQAHRAALDWLRQNDQAGLIKTTVDVPFSAGSEAEADDLVERLAGEGFVATKGCEVHHSSLAASLRRLLEDGVDVPLELLGAYQRRVATVKVSKK